MLRRFLMPLLAAASMAAPVSAAHAGVYGDDLSKCLVQSATPADQQALIVWFFAAIGAHPSVSSFVTLTDAQRAESNKRGAQLFMRLTTADCRAQSVAVLKYEGAAAFGQSFNILGQVAVRGIMNAPEVAREMESFATYADAKKFEQLATEAGIAPPKP